MGERERTATAAPRRPGTGGLCCPARGAPASRPSEHLHGDRRERPDEDGQHDQDDKGTTLRAPAGYGVARSGVEAKHFHWCAADARVEHQTAVSQDAPNSLMNSWERAPHQGFFSCFRVAAAAWKSRRRRPPGPPPPARAAKDATLRAPSGAQIRRKGAVAGMIREPVPALRGNGGTHLIQSTDSSHELFDAAHVSSKCGTILRRIRGSAMRPLHGAVGMAWWRPARYKPSTMQRLRTAAPS